MKDSKLFIISVGAAIVLPLLFGYIYYSGITSKMYSTSVSNSIKTGPELIIENNKLTRINKEPIVDIMKKPPILILLLPILMAIIHIRASWCISMTYPIRNI